MKRRSTRTRVILVAAAVLLIAGSIGMLQHSPAVSSASATIPELAVTIPAAGDIDAKEVSSDLQDIARVWGEAGGTWAFPYWEKGYRRWRDHNINDSTFREYVIAYREQIDPGCDVLDSLDMSTNEGKQVQNLAVAACHSRLSALRDLRKLLDLNIEHQGDTSRDGTDSDGSDEMHVLDSRFQTRLQNSYFATRLAMNGAQSLLRVAKKPALPQDALM